MSRSKPAPQVHETPSHWAERLGQWYASRTTSDHKKEWGQFFTPLPVAEYMASMVAPRSGILRVVDPGAGVGILGCAVCEHLVSGKKRPTKLSLEAYESDPELAGMLENTLGSLRRYLQERGVEFSFGICTDDFVLRNAWLLEESPVFKALDSTPQGFDICIANPPYFKIPKSDPRAQAASRVVHGQPNIYALFMAVSASLMREEGQLIVITPRSFASGPYFRKFREEFFRLVRPERIHVFDSRRDAFKKDGVLQENIILKAVRSRDWQRKNGTTSLHISTTSGAAEFDKATERTVPLSFVLDPSDRDAILHIPADEEDERIMRLFKSWTGSLARFGLEVSTGPVVPFRARRLLAHTAGRQQHAPLFWLQNVQPMTTRWPATKGKKQQYIRVCDDSMSLLLSNQNYVLLRRFSAKEEKKRLTAAPFLTGVVTGPFVGFENHLNYIHRPGGKITADEARGLALLFNSSLFDMYFRMMNGNTQVSASEVRRISLPPHSQIIELGRVAAELTDPLVNLDHLVNGVLFGASTPGRDCA